MPLTLDFDTASLDELLGCLTHEQFLVRADAACALGDRLRTRELVTLDEPLRMRLRRLLDDREVLPRVEAAITLAELQDPEATPILLAAARSRTFRLDAVRALGRGGDSRAIPFLLKLLNGFMKPWADRMQAAGSLCALGNADGRAYLQEKLRSRKSAERAAAIHFLAESRHPEALSLLSTILANALDPHRDVAARALGLLGNPAGKDALLAARAAADADLLSDIEASLAALQPK